MKTVPKGPDRNWARNETGNELHWPLNDYGRRKVRAENWFAGGVVKHHRKL